MKATGTLMIHFIMPKNICTYKMNGVDWSLIYVPNM